MLIECAKRYTTVSVIIDGFDECSQDQQGRVTASLLMPICDAGMKVHLTTRDSCLAQLKSVLKGSSISEIKADRDDIKNCLERKIEDRIDKVIKKDLKTDIIETISGQADGMFNLPEKSLII
jgi:hypothetical protein